MKERAARQLSSLPTTVISRPAAERVYQHVKGAWPSAHPALWLHPGVWLALAILKRLCSLLCNAGAKRG